MVRYLLGLGGLFVIFGAFMRWADRSGQTTPGGQDMALGLKLWPVFLYGGLVLVPAGVVVALVEAVR